jgi:hypothetical protein
MEARGEKRASARSPYERPIRFDLNFMGSEGLMSIEQEGVGVDVSEHGLGLFTGYPLKKGEVLRLHFPLNSIKTTLPVFARVAWAKLIEERFRVGMQFLK